MNKCIQCSKQLNLDCDQLVFCDDICLQDYVNEYIKDNSSDILNEMGGRYE